MSTISDGIQHLKNGLNPKSDPEDGVYGSMIGVLVSIPLILVGGIGIPLFIIFLIMNVYHAIRTML